MNEQLELLRDIQEIDLDIQKIRAFQEEFPQKIKEIQDALESDHNAITDEQEKLQEMIKTRKKLEQSVEDNEINAKKYREQLYQVKTNKEYRALLEQIEETLKLNSKQEDDILKLMEQIENLTAETEKMEKDFKKIEQAYHEKNQELQEQMNSSETELESILNTMNQLKNKVDADLFERYLRIKEQRGGLAVVETRNEVCMGCNLNIPPQMYYEILKNSGVHSCPNCYRLLYYAGPEQQANNIEK